jgi:hypothetical protein
MFFKFFENEIDPFWDELFCIIMEVWHLMKCQIEARVLRDDSSTKFLAVTLIEMSNFNELMMYYH